MKKKLTLFFIYLLFGVLSSMTTLAQKVILSISPENTENTTQEGNQYYFSKGDTLLVRAVYQQQEDIEEAKGYFFIDRKNHLGVYEEYMNEKVWLDYAPEAKKVLSFKENGDYIIAYANHKKEILATDTLHLEYDQSVFFCKSLDEYASPIAIQNSFRCTKSGLSYYYMVMRSAKVFDTHKLLIKIYQYNLGDYRTPISEYWEYVNHEWKQVSYRGAFLKPGQYRVEINKANGEPFATGYFKLLPYIEDGEGKQ